jgi:hypothetical protein
MRSYAATSWLRFVTAAPLALIAAAALAPATARASCGDYVTVSHPARPNAPSDYKPSHTLPDRPEKVNPGSRHLPGRPVLPCQLPCHGPGCSGTPVPPPAPVSTAGPKASQDPWDCLLSVPVSGYADSDTLPSDGILGHPIHRGLSIYHPPRPI